MAFVLDASIAAAWCLRDERDSRAERVLDAAGLETATVPTLFWFEVRNMLVTNERRGRLLEEDGRIFLDLLADLFLDIDTDPSSDQLLAFARAHRLTAYDAAYLELAWRRGLPLATLDERLAAAAQAAGVKLLEG
jgi:predicted nucleic acid-binding protein